MKLIKVKKHDHSIICVRNNDQCFVCSNLLSLHDYKQELSGDDAIVFLLRNKQLHAAIDKELTSGTLIPVTFEQNEVLLPFTMKSLRDFMLFEQHVIDATRGFVRHFMPGKFRITSFLEKLTGKPLKSFRPKPLWYKYPIYYMGNHLNVVGNNASIEFPPYCTALDYELELAAVLAEPLLNATPQQAEAAIGGFVVLNDISARNMQAAEMQSGFGPVKTKNFINAISPIVVSADEILSRIKQLNAYVKINDKVVSTCTSETMNYTIGEAIAYASWGEQLYPGEVFGTGTFPGGSGMETNNWLQHGDKLELHIEEVGSLVSYIK